MESKIIIINDIPRALTRSWLKMSETSLPDDVMRFLYNEYYRRLF